MYIYWFILGAVLIALEMLLPIFIFIFIGIGALVAGLAMFYGISFMYSIVIFSAVSLILLLIFPRFLRNIYKKPAPTLNNMHTNKNAVVTSPIKKNQLGTVELEGSFWSATSEHDLEIGQFVVIIKHDPNNDILLHVNPTNGENS